MTPDAGRPARCQILACNAAFCARSAQDGTGPFAPPFRIAPGQSCLRALHGTRTLPRQTGRVPG